MAPQKITIDWKKVEDLLIAGCSGIEVAAHIGVYRDTLYDRVVEEKGISFTDYSAKLRSKGDSLLRATQFAKALKQDNMMLIWLGKNRLKQSDSQQNDQSGNDPKIGETLDLAKLKAENAELKRLLHESKTGTIDLSSEQAPEHLVRSSSERQDI